MKKTLEQQSIFDATKEGLDSPVYSTNEIFVDAKAGTGKSTLSEDIVESLKVGNYVYTAFNKKIVEEGVRRFGKDNSKTFHAFAYKYFSNPDIGAFYPNAIKERITYTEKKDVVDTLNGFCLSKYPNPYDYFEEVGAEEATQSLVVTYLELMADRKIKHTFDYMLKELHILLDTKDIKIKYDLLLIDEAQDLTPVMLAIFDLVKTKVTMYLGDTSQDIYSFLNLVSAFDDSSEVYELTKSFRLSKEIAERIEPFCQRNIDPHFRIEGVNTDKDTTEAFITHSNAEIIEHTVKRQSSGLGYSFTKPVNEIFDVAINVQKALDGEKLKNPKYWTLNNLITRGTSMGNLVESPELDDDIVNSIKLLFKFRKKGINVVSVLKLATKAKPDHSYLIGTAHSVKGLEMGSVYISDGLNAIVEYVMERYEDIRADSKVPKDVLEEAKAVRVEICKLYYVACSRAKHTLNNAHMLNR